MIRENVWIHKRCTRGRGRHRRGATMVLAAFLFAILIGMLAFAIDVGYIAVSRTEAHRTTDAAALAAGWQILDSLRQNDSEGDAQDKAYLAAQQYAGNNEVCSHGPNLSTNEGSGDIELGYLSALDRHAALENNPNNPFRAVRVRVRKNSGWNGQVPLYFAKVFGQSGRDLTVESTAALAVQIRGFKGSVGDEDCPLDILPFALDEETWLKLKNGQAKDNYQWTENDNPSQGVSSGGDGIQEVNLYPQGTGSPGNRGTVDIGGSDNATTDISRQIISGISDQDLEELGKPLCLNEEGFITLEGETGISAGVKDELTSIVGQTRVIPIFRSVIQNGNTAIYTIVCWEGVRIMNVRLTGPMNKKEVIVQPAGVMVKNVIPGDGTRTWSQGVYSPVVLVK